MSKRAASGEAHLRGLAPGQCSYEDILLRRGRVVIDIGSDLTSPGIKLVIYRTDSNAFNQCVSVGFAVLNNTK